jgi:SAM-dependent methyltransferase
MPYDSIAHYYHLIHQAHTADIPWVLRWATGQVLELGCGSGRLLLPLVHAGHAVVGLDASAEMLTIARKDIAQSPTAVQKRITLVHGDMTQFDLSQKPFDTAVIFCNTLLHLDEMALQQALHHTAKHLLPGGQLLIDVPNPFVLAAAEDDDTPTLEQLFTDPTTNEQIAQYSTQRLNLARQTLTLGWSFVPQQNGRDLTDKTVSATAVYHFYYPHQLQLALQASGFKLQGLYGDYTGQPFSEESDHLLIVAQRH